MAKQRKSSLSLNPVQMIPFDQLVLSQANVRRRKANVSIDDLANDITRRGLLQAINVRPEIDADGSPTGRYHIPAGGRRYRALELLVKQKLMAKSDLVPCIVRSEAASTSAEEDSLAENTMRESLHPLDQFTAFKTLRDQGMTTAEIAARFFVPEQVVLQRLRLTTVSPKLLEVYADDQMTLKQLEAFTVTDDHARQESVWEAVKGTPYYAEPYNIRHRLTEKAIRGNDKRVLCVGIERYEAAGGTVVRDLFSDRDTTLLEDVDLLDRLVKEALADAATKVAAEGWKWVQADVSFPYNQFYAYGRLQADSLLSAEEVEKLDNLVDDLDALDAEWEDVDDLPEHVVTQRGILHAEIDALEERRATFSPSDRAQGGVIINIATDGTIVVDRGYVHPDDLRPLAAAQTPATDEVAVTEPSHSSEGPQNGSIVPLPARITVGPLDPPPAVADHEADDDTKAKPLSEALIAELSGHRTMALRAELGGDPDMALLALLHTMVVKVMNPSSGASCLEVRPTFTSPRFADAAIGNTPAAQIVNQRHEHWKARLPQDTKAVWDFLFSLSNKDKFDLLAHVTSLTANVIVERFSQRAAHVAQGDQLAAALNLDLVAAGWRPTVDNYLGRVSKARILEAVAEGCGDAAASLIEHLKKGDMAIEAERLLKPTNWLPEMLRARPGDDTAEPDSSAEDDPGEALPSFLNDDDTIEEASEDASADALVAAE